MTNHTTKGSRVRGVGLALGSIMLLALLMELISPSSMRNFNATDEVIKFLVQTAAAVFLLFSSWKLDLKNEKSVQVFRYACCAALLYVAIIAVDRFDLVWESFGLEVIPLVILTLSTAISMLPFIWCMKNAKTPKHSVE